MLDVSGILAPVPKPRVANPRPEYPFFVIMWIFFVDEARNAKSGRKPRFLATKKYFFVVERLKTNNMYKVTNETSNNKDILLSPKVATQRYNSIYRFIDQLLAVSCDAPNATILIQACVQALHSNLVG